MPPRGTERKKPPHAYKKTGEETEWFCVVATCFSIPVELQHSSNLHGDISSRRGAQGAHKKTSPADHTQRRVPDQAHPRVLQLRGSRRSQDVAHDDEGEQDHGDLCDGRVLHLEEAFGSLLHVIHDNGRITAVVPRVASRGPPRGTHVTWA